MSERYAAFISYSHDDRRVAEWLHRALEAFHTPGPLVGTIGANGPVPARLRPIFRDRSDLSASADLAASVQAALDASDALVVICSPAAAASRWVAEEVDRFERRAGEARVLALVVDGEPFAEDPAMECLPDPIKHRLSDGVLVEPMAADLRDTADGKRLAFLKIAAGLLGVPLDRLARREQARRQRGWAIAAGLSALGMAVTGGLALDARAARDQARVGRADAEKLVEFMLGDLRGKLDQVGRLDIMDAVGRETLRYYDVQRPSSLDGSSLGRRSRALLLVGELAMLRADLPRAERAFAEAAATTDELLRRDPDNGARLFDHAQSVFWRGSVARTRRDMPAAEAAFDEYARLAARLTALDPAKSAWASEAGQARLNQGVIKLETRQPAEATRAFTLAAGIFARLARAEPGEAQWRLLRAQSLAWLADAERWQGRFEAARRARRLELALYAPALARDPRDSDILEAVARARGALAELALDQGRPAMADARAARAIMSALLRVEAGNADWMARAIEIDVTLAEAARAAGDRGAAIATLDRAQALVDRLLGAPSPAPRHRLAEAKIDLMRAELALASGAPEMAAWLGRDAGGALARMRRAGTLPANEVAWLARADIARARAAEAAAGDARGAWRSAAALIAGQAVPSPEERCLLAAAWRATGREAAAGRLIGDLGRAGYVNPVCVEAVAVRLATNSGG